MRRTSSRLLMWWPKNSWTKHDGWCYHQQGKEKELLACQHTALRNKMDNRWDVHASKESQEWGVFSPVTSEIWTIHWICVVSQLAPLRRCPTDLSWFLSIKTWGWAEGTRHDRVECLIHAFSQGENRPIVLHDCLVLFLLNKRQNIKPEQMCASGGASQTVSISSYRRVSGLFHPKIYWAALNSLIHNIVLSINPNNKANKANLNVLAVKNIFCWFILATEQTHVLTHC